MGKLLTEIDSAALSLSGDLSLVLMENVNKLRDRAARNKSKGDGDNR